jgi:glycosyltransferase involved in cell wall biosynthesis
MKVLVAGTGGSIVSGISTAADEMVRTLDSLGHDAERFTAGAEMRRRGNAMNLQNVVAVLADARSLFRRARHARADVVWVHTFGPPMLPALRSLALVAACRLARRRVVVQFHAFGLEQSVAEGGSPLRLTLRLVMALAHAVVVLHEPAAAVLRPIRPRSTVHVLPNWVEVPEERTALPPCPPLRLVFVGGVVRRKGAPQLIDAVRSLGSVVQLRLVGGAAEDGEEAFERLQDNSRDLVEAGRVTFAGELDAAGVRAELRAAHLFVLPSEAEGTPIAMLEAMAEGRPVLVTRAGNMGDVVEATGCGWVLPDREPATIAATLRAIRHDEAGLEAASVRAQQAARDRYSPAAQRGRIDRILSEATRRR